MCTVNLLCLHFLIVDGQFLLYYIVLNLLTNLQFPLKTLHLALQPADEIWSLPHVFDDFALQMMQPEDGDVEQQ